MVTIIIVIVIYDYIYNTKVHIAKLFPLNMRKRAPQNVYICMSEKASSFY